MRKNLAALLAALTIVLLSGCANSDYPLVYKINIPQGNSLTTDKIKQLKVGMTEEQVVYLLGSPMLRDIFHINRWDYPFNYKPARGERIKAHLTVYFDKGLVTEFKSTGDWQAVEKLHIPTYRS